MRSFTLRSLLSWLITIVFVPSIVIVVLLGWRLSDVQHAELDATLLQGAQALSLATDRDIAGRVRALQALAESPPLQSDDLQGFHAFAVRAMPAMDAQSLALFSPDGRQVLNATQPFGTVLPQPILEPFTKADPDTLQQSDLSAIQEALAGRAGNTNLFSSVLLKRAVFSVAVPVSRAGKVAYALVAAFSTDDFARLLSEQFSRNVATIVDGNGFIVARAFDGVASVGQKVRLLGGFSEGRENGFGHGTNRDGRSIAFAFQRSRETGWISTVGIDVLTVAAAERQVWGLWAGLMAVILVCALAAGAYIARLILHSVTELTRASSGEPGPGTRIAEFRTVEMALAELNRARERENAEREQRLVAEVKRDEQARENQRKDVYLATLAHELRNPLAPMRNAVTFLRMKGPRDPDLDWARDVIDRQITQMARLLDDLLDLSRIARGRIQLQKTVIDVGELLKEVAQTHGPLAASSGKQLQLEVPSQPVWVSVDRVRLAEVMQNLVGNALKYTRPGASIQLRLASEGGEAVIRVEDDGIGISPDLLAQVFEPFTQAHDTRQGGQSGLGIGLALAKGLVELHGGTITAASAGLGCGSQFTVRLGLSSSAPANGRTSVQPSALKLQASVLIADDNRDAADSLARVLSELCTGVVTVYDGIAAVSAAAQHTPDVAILDIDMPGLTGNQVAAQLAGRPQKPYLIALSGLAQETDRARAMQSGFDVHFAKPVDVEELVALIRRVIPARPTPAADLKLVS